MGTIAIGEVSASVLVALWPAHVNMAELTSLNFTYHNLGYLWDQVGCSYSTSNQPHVEHPIGGVGRGKSEV